MDITKIFTITPEKYNPLLIFFVLSILVSCGGGTVGSNQNSSSSTTQAPNPQTPVNFRLELCDAAPFPSIQPFNADPELEQSSGCIVNYTQTTTDPETIEFFSTDTFDRRYLVYAPEELPIDPAPVVFVFHGGTGAANAESSASLYTHTSFERLADENGFIVVYGNGLTLRLEGTQVVEEGGWFHSCFAPHAGEGIDVQYVREILDQLENELNIDRNRVYATGLSAGGGMALQLALEAPDIVAAIAPVAPLPWESEGEWLFECNPHPNRATVSIAMYAATADRFIPYLQGAGIEFPDNNYPGMEETRDRWLEEMGITGTPTIELRDNIIETDSYEAYTGMVDSVVEVYKYPAGALGSEYWFYKADGAGHWWPHPTQSIEFFWEQFGKTNQDIDFAEEAWEFFQRHSK